MSNPLPISPVGGTQVQNGYPLPNWPHRAEAMNKIEGWSPPFGAKERAVNIKLQ